ncbi:conjugal transfer protein TraI [Chitinophaga rhizophila]|uniref:Conjugal transfer protein TraI n=1 Tax=Chitinophaga rhizophila TaxID=2866212 RepID=A0ABS7G715_9BACT|nr:conjugal transfer protein TraI [Chitinophaga rhizophila]MBW8683448.1 conjugal transfer protein TraI [Chitinophaga rhizophila]
MKRWVIVITVLLTISITIAPTKKSHAIVIEIAKIIQAAVKKVIKAIDLQIQRFQNETIKLQNAQRILENELSKLKLDQIADWANKTKTIYQDYFDELWRVKNILAYYKRVRQVMENQVQLVNEYKRAYNSLKRDKNFSTQELAYILEVYEGIMKESIENINQITLVIESFTTQMSDASRLEMINAAAERIESNIAAARKFTSQNILISIQRSKTKAEMDVVKMLYGLK